ncbi:streptophobe family protein [Streptomyces gilvosporeus]|uniref:Integral membrane protein n=1 Tax=Streptomyces gilvosporeus TaxID=553510 RepID=A0A1V0TZN3_9ACTN|nr:streptophobe family protein [Streptomyces gilvosporeus]ARF58132.1 hypothetical protein B1H19_31655 [Streptomyces gilvosporeus]
MSQPQGPAPDGPLRLWGQALAAAAAGIVAMGVVAAIGLQAAGAGDLPGYAFPHVVAAAVTVAAGGTVALTGNAGDIAQAHAALDAVPLSVTLAGALATAAVFLRPLRHRAVATGRELLARIARTAVCWLVFLLLVALAAHHTFTISVGNDLADRIGAEIGATPTVGFGADVPATLATGLLWLLALLALAFLVSRRAPLPSPLLRPATSLRPPAFAMALVLLTYVAVALITAVVVLITKGHPAQTVAVVFLGLPNLAWLALGIGTGGAWSGHVDKAIGLPVPQVLDHILRTRHGQRTLDLGAVVAQDARGWLLVALAAVVLLTAAFLAAVRSPATTPLWRHATTMAAALAITLLAVGLLTRILAHYGLSLFGVGDLGGNLGGEVVLLPQLPRLFLAGAASGLVTGAAGSLAARRVRHRGEVGERRPPA